MSDPSAEAIEEDLSHTTIVFHVTSTKVSAGFASDPDCQISIPQVIARKLPVGVTAFVPEDEYMSSELAWYISDSLPIINEATSQIREDCKQPLGGPAEVDPLHPFSNINKVDIIPHLADCSTCKWDWEIPTSQYAIGDEALRIPVGHDFVLRWPLGGHPELTFATDASYTKTSALNDVFAIWKSLLHVLFLTGSVVKQNEGSWTPLSPTPKVLSQYSAILVLPDDPSADVATSLTSLLLSDFGFSSALLLNESVASAFSFGLSSCIVVDLGPMTTKICTVEDGMTLSLSRLSMPFGYESCCTVLSNLIENWGSTSSTPSFNFSTINPQHRQMLKTILYDKCHAYSPSQSSTKFDLCLHSLDGLTHVRRHVVIDDLDWMFLLYAPIAAYFFPLAFGLHTSAPSSPSDVKDKDKGQEGPLPPFDTPYQTFPLGTAVVECFRRIGRSDLRKRLLGTVILTGEGAKLGGISQALAWSIRQALVEANLETQADRIEVHTENRAQVSPENAAWKGGAIVGCICGVNEELRGELYCSSKEFREYGYRSLKSRSTFMFG
ncbi:hypothetical protein RCL1_000540 [Eukaryota sp. TZLM3-RCL]